MGLLTGNEVGEGEDWTAEQSEGAGVMQVE